MTLPIVKTLDLPCAAARAFDIFVNATTSWWPGGHSVSAGAGAVPQAITIEPRVGGAVYETMHDGARADWGEVLDYEEGVRLAMTWHPGNNADNPTRVEVAFEDLPGGRSRVTLTHTGWEAWGDTADDRRQGYDAGWDIVLGENFVPACAVAA